MIPKAAFYCYLYLVQPGHPCVLGEWRDPAHTIVMPGTYTGEDTDRNPQLLRQGRRVKR